MASGSFCSSTYTYIGSNTYKRYFYCNWSQINNAVNNTSTITWALYGGAEDSLGASYGINCGPISLVINGTTVCSITESQRLRVVDGQKIAGGTLTVNHSADGTKSCAVSIAAAIYYYEVNSTYSGSITLTPNPVYTLSTSAGTGSTITVNRTYSPSGLTGKVTQGTKKLFKNDILRISFGANANYSLSTHTVNGETFTSGNQTTVSGNIAIVSTAIEKKSTITATNAVIGKNSIITVTRHNSSYTHTITYSFAGANGTVVTKSAATSITWTVPVALHNKIPSAKSGTCVLKIETFNGNTSLGSNSITITLSADSAVCAPTLTGTVTDTNAITAKLTGNASKVILNASTANCVLSTSMQYGASVAAATINGQTVTVSGGSASKSLPKVSASSFSFYVKDSRGYTKSLTVNSTAIPYIPLTLNGSVVRSTPTGSEAKIVFNGNFYNGNFRSGSVANTLKMQYRYKESNGSYSQWIPVTGTPTISSGTYRLVVTRSDIDYRTAYNFQLAVQDGSTVDGEWVQLTSITKTIVLTRSIPIFDWGSDDFKFNVPIFDEFGTQISNGSIIGGTGSDANITLEHISYTAGTSQHGPIETGCYIITLFGSAVNRSAETARIQLGIPVAAHSDIVYRRAFVNGAWNEWVGSPRTALIRAAATTNPNAQVMINAPGTAFVPYGPASASPAYYDGVINLGSANYRWNTVYAKTGTISTSDRREKEFIEPINGAAELILSIEPVQFQYKKGDSGRTHFGFIAQQVKEAMNSAGINDCAAFIRSPKDETAQYSDDLPEEAVAYSLRYQELLAPLVSLVQIQQRQIESLTARVEQLEMIIETR